MGSITASRILAVAALGLSLTLAADEPAKKNKAKASDKKAASQKSKGKAAAAKPAGDPAKGEELYKANCAVCHFADKSDKRIGPGLLGYFKKEKMENGKPVDDANTREIIMEGYGKMIAFKAKLDEKQLDDLMAYLSTL